MTKWSTITWDHFRKFVEEADKVVVFANDNRIHPFAAAIAGVAFIKNYVKAMDSDLEWWLEWLRKEGPMPPDAEPWREPPKGN